MNYREMIWNALSDASRLRLLKAYRHKIRRARTHKQIDVYHETLTLSIRRTRAILDRTRAALSH